MENVDVCIIGGGMAGASVAYHLAPHASVLVLEREPHVGYHSTGRSAATYSPQYGSPLIRLLTEASGEFFRSPPAAFAAAPILSPRGFLTIGRADQREALERHAGAATSSGQTAVRLSGTEARALVPSLRGEIDWGLLDPEAMDMDVEALLQGFLRGARELGARLETSTEAITVARAGESWRLEAASGSVRARIVVNAAGAWADAVAGLAGVAPLGLVPHRRTAFIFEAPDGVATARWPMVLDAEERFYFRPDAGRLLGSLAEEVPSPPCDAQPDDYDVAVAVDRIERVIDFGIRRVLRSWTGLRTFGPDRDPVSGFDPVASGFYWHAGIGGYGIQTSAAFGAFAAATILGRTVPEGLADRGLTAAQVAPARLRR